MHLDFTHIVSLREWSGFICTAWKSLRVRVAVSHMWTPGGEIWFRIFSPSFSSKPSLCWGTTFRPYLGQPHTFPVFLASAHRPPLIFPGPVMTRTQGTVTLCSTWALLWQRFHTVSSPIPELPLSLISYWLAASGWIPESGTAAAHRSRWRVAWVLSESCRRWTCQQWRSAGPVFHILQAALGLCSFACWFVDFSQKLCFLMSLLHYTWFFFFDILKGDFSWH